MHDESTQEELLAKLELLAELLERNSAPSCVEEVAKTALTPAEGHKNIEAGVVCRKDALVMLHRLSSKGTLSRLTKTLEQGGNGGAL